MNRQSRHMILLSLLIIVFLASCNNHSEMVINSTSSKQTIHQYNSEKHTINKYTTKQSQTDITIKSNESNYTLAKNTNITMNHTSAQPTTIADSEKLNSYFYTEDKEKEWNKGNRSVYYCGSFIGVYDKIYKWGDFKVGETSEGISIMRYNGGPNDVVIPEQINGKPVIALEGNETRDADDGELYYVSPFEGYNYKYIEIKTLSLPSTLKTIGSQALDTVGLERYIVSKDNLYYTAHNGVLYTKDMKVLLSIPEKYKKNKYKIPEGVEVIHSAAFEKKRFKDIVIPASIEKIENYYDLSAVRVLEDNKHFSSIDGSLYNKEKTKLLRYNLNLKDTVFTFPKTVTIIGARTYFGDKIEELRITENINKIHFTYTVKLVYSGKTDTYTAKWIPKNLKSIVVDENNKHFSSEDGVLFNKDKSKLLLYPPNRPNQAYEIPKTVKSFKVSAVSRARKLNEIIIGKNVKKINYNYSIGRKYIIRGYKGTAAEKFAKEYRLVFIVLDEEKTTETKTNPTTTTATG